MAMLGLVLGTPPVLDVMAFALLALHDLVDTTRRTVLAVVVEATTELPFLVFAVTLVDVAASVMATQVLVEAGT
jgi:ABC-type methionine transport system permease subunit